MANRGDSQQTFTDNGIVITISFPYADTEPERYAEVMDSLYTVVIEDGGVEIPIGYMLRSVYAKLVPVPVSIKGEMDLYPARGVVSILRDQPTEAGRTRTVAALAAHWRDQKAFRILSKWRNELWPVYGPRKQDGGDDELLFSMERMAMGLFGCTRYGVHMTAFVVDPSATHGLRIWVPTRAADKSSYPGMLDNTVAGGFMTGEDFFECMVREADEEASLSADLVRQRAQEVGTISYIYVTDERSGGEPGLIYPEVQWVYDLELPADVVPSPKDGEVERFDLCTVEEAQEHLARGRFKPNCAVILVDFFIRHGILTKENEPCYDEFLRRAHRRMPFPGPHTKHEKALG